MRNVLDWLRRNDPLGSTLKGGIVAVVGVVFLLGRLPWIGAAFLVVGILMVGAPFWLNRRDQERERRWRSRRP